VDKTEPRNSGENKDSWLVVEPYPSEKCEWKSVGIMKFPTACKSHSKFHGSKSSKPPTRSNVDRMWISGEKDRNGLVTTGFLGSIQGIWAYIAY
jgi:hypothetical protein